MTAWGIVDVAGLWARPVIAGAAKSPLPGLVPGIHVFDGRYEGQTKTWVAGASPATGHL